MNHPAYSSSDEVIAVLVDLLREIYPMTHAGQLIRERIAMLRPTSPATGVQTRPRAATSATLDFLLPPPLESRPPFCVHPVAGDLWLIASADMLTADYRTEGRWVVCRSRERGFYWALETRPFRDDEAYVRGEFNGPFADRENAIGQARHALTAWARSNVALFTRQPVEQGTRQLAEDGGSHARHVS